MGEAQSSFYGIKLNVHETTCGCGVRSAASKAEESLGDRKAGGTSAQSEAHYCHPPNSFVKTKDVCHGRCIF